MHGTLTLRRHFFRRSENLGHPGCPTSPILESRQHFDGTDKRGTFLPHGREMLGTLVALATCLDRWRANTSPTSPLDLDASVERRFERRHRLYEEFRAMRPRPPALHLHIATYPVAVMLVVPPTSLVFGRPSDLSEDTEEELLRSGVRQLATTA